MTYRPPLADQCFTLKHVAAIQAMADLPRFAQFDPQLVEAILAESGKLAEHVFAPLNQVGDRVGARWNDGGVELPPGFRDAFRSHAAGGWSGITADPRHGGQGLPFALGCAVQEQLVAANAGLTTCLLLTQGTIEALQAHASDELQARFLPRLISGEWSGTMHLTEPQAGSDVGAIRTLATPHPDGTWHLRGQKIFITYGEHDGFENIVHLVLARTPDAPPGTRGLSLFLVPKLLVVEDGSLAAHNGVRCMSIEKKLGIHASPTCTMSYGEEEDCVGYLVGSEQRGMAAMFTMMNHARVDVGVQGVAMAERAFQAALAYARDRVQGRRIIEFADVRRMILTMKVTTEAARALAYYTAAAIDRASAGCGQSRLLADLLTPVTKAYCSDVGVEVANMAIQVFGGMGFIEETGVAQHLRDARIAPIYEGTNGIQAMDLVSRKLPQARWANLFDDMRRITGAMSATLQPMVQSVRAAIDELDRVTRWLVEQRSGEEIGAGAALYLRMFGTTMGAYLLGVKASAAMSGLQSEPAHSDFFHAKIGTAHYFAEHVLAQLSGLAAPIQAGARTLQSITEAQLAL